MANIIKYLARSKNSSSSSSALETRANKKIVSIEEIENHLQNWSIPKTPFAQVYNKGSFCLNLII